MNDERSQRVGVAYGAGAFLWWGLSPFYFKALGPVDATEILAHRVVWSLVFLLVLLGAQGRLGATLALARDRRTLATLALTSLLVAVNWLLFIWSIVSGRLVEASLGYFINPLMNVLLGFVFLRERLRRPQAVAVGLAALAVAWLTVQQGRPPWIALTLAVSFGFYGLLRKTGRPGGLQGLAVETALLAPVALGYLAWRERAGVLAFAHDGAGLAWLLAAAGPVTALPLVWFAEGARRLRYATMGFLQYLAPSLQFVLAVAVFGEPFGTTRAVGFAGIWAALALYTADTVRGRRRGPTGTPSPGRSR